MIRDVNDWNLKDNNKKGIVYYLAFITVLIGVMIILVACQSPQKAELRVSEICEDGYVYKIWGATKKQIVVENGEFKSCYGKEVEF